MKSIILKLALLTLFEDIACNKDILSQFKQNGYRIKDKRTEVIRFNTEIFYKFEIKTFKYNRTTPALNGTVHAKVNVADKLEDVIYHCCNFVPNENYLPPLIPNGLYKLEALILYLNQEAALLNLYGEVHTPIAYPKK